tara:strand:+ start:2079 stop:2534 length:456 start_codon:yes stop_codon:yes gene_type:complete
MSSKNNRESRSSNTRETKTRAVYTPSSSLPVPNKRPGIKHRWIATHVLGESVQNNVSKKNREGWEPVKADDYPELRLTGDVNGNVELGGLMLCSMPEELVEARTEYFKDKSQAQIDSVDNNFMRNSDPRMPLFSDKRSSTTKGAGFGSGTK